MPSMLVSGIQENVAGAAAFLITPPADQGYLIEYFGSDQAQVGAAGCVPDLQIEATDGGAHAACIAVIDPTTAVHKSRRKFGFYVDADHPLQVRNTAAGAADIFWSGHRVNPNNIITEIYTAPNAGTVDIQPPAGEVWLITEIAGENQGANNRPDVNVALTNGVLVAALIMDETHDLGQDKLLNWVISHDLYLQVAPIAAADCDFAIFGIRIPVTHFGDIQDLAGSGNMDIQPPDGSEAVITTFGVQTWANTGAEVAPRGAPDVAIRMTTAGGLLPNIMEAGSLAVAQETGLWNSTLALEIDHDTWLNVLEVSTANNEVAYSGYLKRQYNP